MYAPNSSSSKSNSIEVKRKRTEEDHEDDEEDQQKQALLPSSTICQMLHGTTIPPQGQPVVVDKLLLGQATAMTILWST